jgi:hypothetical protein
VNRPLTKYRVSLQAIVMHIPQDEAIELAKECGPYDDWGQCPSELRTRVERLVEMYPVPKEWREKLGWDQRS